MRFSFKMLSAVSGFLALLASTSVLAQDYTGATSLTASSVTASDPAIPITSALPPNYPANRSYSAPVMPPTSLELDYSRRTGSPLRLFGRAFLSPTATTAATTSGAVSGNYIVGIGDEFIVTVRGTPSRSWRVRVDREGRIVLPELAPIAAAGQSFNDIRATMEDLAAKTWPGSSIFISLGAVRQINVTIVGEIGGGSRNLQLSGFSTVLDALTSAGGILPTGSLRQIRIIRAGTPKPITIDLYTLLTGSAVPDLALADGDRIIVPPLGRTVAVSGDVALPGIFELPAGTETLPATEAVRLAGGLLRPEGNRFLHLAFDRQGKDRTQETSTAARLSLHSSDILLVARSANEEIGQVQLEGHVRVPGIRSLAFASTVRDLVGEPSALSPNPYLPFAALLTTDPTTLARHFVPVDLDRVLSGTAPNPPLAGDDALIVLSMSDIRYLASADVQAVLNGRGPVSATAQAAVNNPPQSATQARAQTNAAANLPLGLPAPPPSLIKAAGVSAGDQAASVTPSQGVDIDQGQGEQVVLGTQGSICSGLRSLSTIVNSGRASRFNNAIVPAAEGRTDTQGQALQNIQPCPVIFDRYPSLLPFVLEYAIALGGEVRQPGVYPVTSDVTLASVVSAAGDVTRQADLSNIELTRFTDNQDTGQATVTRSTLALNRSQFASLRVRPGDVLRFNPVYEDRDDGPVTISGEVKLPGSYNILRGEKLSSLLRRAGGLGREAYPYGAVLTRERIRAQERESIERSIRELQSGMSAALATSSATSTDQTGTSIQGMQSLILQLRQAQPVGRVVIEADPEQLAIHPDRDVNLEPGDVLVIPKRPDWVTITGEVLNPSSQQFRPSLKASEYIAQAGGVTYHADVSREFVVLPNGLAQSLKTSFWNFSAQPIPPGSVIIVPRDLSPDTLAATKDIVQVLSSLAIGAASLVVIGR